ncbi:MAG: Fic family protein [Ignavibacteria bacterium]|nr:Fic family protein [Ignavibacteria bacterium]
MKLLDILARIEECKIQVDALRPISQDSMVKLNERLRLEWDYNSNAIEGNTLTFSETRTLILNGYHSGNKFGRHYEEMKLHHNVLLVLEDLIHQNSPISEVLIRNLHHELMGDKYVITSIDSYGNTTTREGRPGEYKDIPNGVRRLGEGFRNFTPPGIQTESAMQELVFWIKNEEQNPTHNLIELAALFHFKFVSIHPFDDGNGRMGRILMNLILMRCGYAPAIVRVADRERYIQALAFAQDGDSLEPFVTHIAEETLTSMELLLKAAKGENIEDPDHLDKRIAVLSAKISGKKSGKFRRTNKEMIEAMEKSIVPLFNKIAVILAKVDSFFLDKFMYFGYKKFKSSTSIHAIELQNNELVSSNFQDIPDAEFNYPRDFLPIAKFKPPLFFMVQNSPDTTLIDELDSVNLQISWSRSLDKTNENDLNLSANISVTFLPDTYSIGFDGKLIEKEYGDNLTTEECEKLAKEQASLLLNIIEQHSL